MLLSCAAAHCAVANNAHCAEQPGSAGLMKGTGKPVCASAHGQSRATRMFLEEPQLNTAATDVPVSAALVARSTRPAEHPQSTFTGFATGSDNKPVQLSAHGQAHAKRMFQGDTSSKVAASTATDGSALAASSTEPAKQQSCAVTGFATGSGSKPVHLSAHGQAHAMQMFQQGHPCTTAVQTATDNALGDSRRAEVSDLPQPTCTGFASGCGNNPVHLSARGQAHAWRMFQTEPPGETAASKATDSLAQPASSAQPAEQQPSAFTGFTSGSSNNRVQLSAHGQAQARRMFQEQHPSSTAVSEANNSTQPADLPQAACTCFATGSGHNAVQLSAHGQAHARQMFQQDPDLQKLGAEVAHHAESALCTGFKRGANSQSVAILAAKQAYARHLFDHEQAPECPSKEATAGTDSAAGPPSAKQHSAKQQQQGQTKHAGKAVASSLSKIASCCLHLHLLSQPSCLRLQANFADFADH